MKFFKWVNNQNHPSTMPYFSQTDHRLSCLPNLVLNYGIITQFGPLSVNLIKCKDNFDNLDFCTIPVLCIDQITTLSFQVSSNHLTLNSSSSTIIAHQHTIFFLQNLKYFSSKTWHQIHTHQHALYKQW